MDLKTRLKQLRKEKGITQTDLSKAVNIPRSSIAGYETDVAEPDISKLKDIAEYFNVTTDYLIGKSDIRKTADEISTNTDNVLSEKNKKDIAKQMQLLRDSLKNSEGLMFNGDELNEETKDLLLTAIEKDIEAATIINKKYTPKKYRK